MKGSLLDMVVCFLVGPGLGALEQQRIAARPDGNGKPGLTGGAIAGLVLGVVAACALAAVLGLLLYKRRAGQASSAG